MFFTNLLADFFHGLVHVIAHRPVLAAGADAVNEVGDDLPASRRVDDFRVELQAEEFLRTMLDGGIARNFQWWR